MEIELEVILIMLFNLNNYIPIAHYKQWRNNRGR